MVALRHCGCGVTVARLAYHLNVGLQLQEGAQTLSHHCVVVNQ
jgi:hypothetical protein